jgi:hypothetical protein
MDIPMNWLWLRAEIKTVVLGVALVGILALLAIRWGYAPQQAANAGFGPEWDCTTTLKGGPVCMKKIGGK